MVPRREIAFGPSTFWLGAALLPLLLVAGCSTDAASASDGSGAGSGGAREGAGGSAGGLRATGGEMAGGAAGGLGQHVGGAGGGAGAADGGGTGGGQKGGGGASGGGSGVAFAAVQVIFANHCVACHDPDHPVVPETTTFVALNLTAAGAYAALVNRAAVETCGGERVTPGDPQRSYLYQKITEAAPCDGGEMPARGMLAIQPTLTAGEIATVVAWISSGAKP
jgi:hypothetical protein